MRKILFALPMIMLLAAACNAQNQASVQSQPSSQPAQATDSPDVIPTLPNNSGGETQKGTHIYQNNQSDFEFRYPENYSVGEGVKSDLGNLYIPVQKYFAVNTGAQLLVTASMPKNEYPSNTDFGGGFFSVAINKNVKQADCLKFDPAYTVSKSLNIKINGVVFVKATLGGGAMGHQSRDEVYHAYHNGICYELQTGMRTGGYGAVDSITKQVNGDEVIAKLNLILNTFAFTK